MTTQVNLVRYTTINKDWKVVHPIKQTGPYVQYNKDIRWVEVESSMPGTSWVQLDKILTIRKVEGLLPGRYLYLGHYFQRAVNLTGFSVSVMGKEYYIIRNDTIGNPGELSLLREYQIAPAENFYKIMDE